MKLDHILTLKIIRGFMFFVDEDAEWCVVVNPDCSYFYTQQSCKKYCNTTEGNFQFVYYSKI